MKKMALLIFVFILGARFAFAEDSDTTTKNNAAFFIGFGAGSDLPSSGWDSNYTLGGGAQAFSGYAFDKNWACRVDVENWFFEGNNFSLYNLRTLASLKYTFSMEVCQPYLMAGAGVVYSSLVGVSAINLDALAGLGVQFDLTADTHFFVEAKYNFILPVSGSLQDIPINTGIWASLP